MADVPPADYPLDPETASDPELITLVRSGDTAAFEQLFVRHRDAAVRYAQQIAGADRAEDLSAEAFTKIFDLLQRGKGPDIAFRAYLLTTVRTAHVNTIRAGHREDLVPDYEPTSRLLPVTEDPDERFDRDAVAHAFGQLPERWQAALWLTTVEGASHEDVGLQLGISPNAVASLTYRARAGLREAYLAEHLLDTTEPHCRRVVELLPSYLRGSLTPRRRRHVAQHLQDCVRCATAAAELAEVDRDLGALLIPLGLLGLGATTAVGALSGGTAAAAAGATLKGKVLGWGASLPSGVGSKMVAATTVTMFGLGVGSQFYGPPPPGRPPVPLPIGVGASESPRPLQVAPSVSALPEGPGPTAMGAPAPPTDAPTIAAPTPAPTPGPRPRSGPVPPPRPTSPPSAARTMAMGPMRDQRTTIGPVTWDEAIVTVTDAVKDTEIVVTTNNTIKVAPITTPMSGWICGLPQISWFANGPLADTRVTCAYNGHGDGGPLRFWYVVGGKATLRAELIVPQDYQDTSVTDNVGVLDLG